MDKADQVSVPRELMSESSRRVIRANVSPWFVWFVHPARDLQLSLSLSTCRDLADWLYFYSMDNMETDHLSARADGFQVGVMIYQGP